MKFHEGTLNSFWVTEQKRPYRKIYFQFPRAIGWLCWGLTSQSTIFQSCRDGAIASWVINQYFRGVKCLAQGHNTAEVGLEPRTSRSGVRYSTTEPPRSPPRAITPKIHNPELWFLRSARRLIMLYICVKFHENISNGFWVTERTRFCDRRTDGQTTRAKTICLPTLRGQT